MSVARRRPGRQAHRGRRHGRLVAEDDTVVGRFRSSGTHFGTWRGHPPTGRRFERVDEVYFFRVKDGKVARAWGLEDTLARHKQLGLAPGIADPDRAER